LIGLHQLPDAVYNILLAYVEDTLDTAADSEDDADRCPAAVVLRDSFLLKLRILRDIKATSRRIKFEGKWREATTPEEVLRSAVGGITTGSLQRFLERPDLRLGPTPLGFPQPRERRVFIGMNYDVLSHVIPEMKAAVILKGYTPIIAAEVIFPPQQTHDVSLLLLHTCGYALFDITVAAGQYMEIERARDYGTRVLLLRSAPIGHPPYFSQMIQSLGYSTQTYQSMNELRQHIAKFLP
jgi:hypothetical protein